MKNTPKNEGYTFIYNDDKEYAFLNNDTGLLEFFTPNKNFTGWALEYRGTRLEFTRAYTDAQMLMFKRGIQSILHWGEQHPSFKYAYRVMSKLNKINK